MEFSLKGRKKARILSKPDKDRSVHSKLKSIIGGFWRVSCSIASPRDVSGKSSAADYIFKTPFHQPTSFSNATTVCLRCHVTFQTFKGALLTRFLAEKRSGDHLNKTSRRRDCHRKVIESSSLHFDVILIERGEVTGHFVLFGLKNHRITAETRFCSKKLR